MSDNLVSGRVKFWENGRGLIKMDRSRLDGLGRRVFVNADDLRGSGLDCLPAGSKVQFEAFRHPDGKVEARNIQITEQPPPPVRMTGTVIRYDELRDHAVVTAPNHDEVLIFENAMEMAGISALRPGQRVAFSLRKPPRGGRPFGVDVELVTL